jgi:hypothetical protein
MCTVLLPPGVNPIAVKNISCHIRYVLQCSDGLSNKVSNIIRRLMDNMKLLLICILRVLLSHYIFINVYVVLFMFNNVIYVFFLYYCMFIYGYPD